MRFSIAFFVEECCRLPRNVILLFCTLAFASIFGQLSLTAQTNQLLLTLKTNSPVSAVGSGNSFQPIISRDGRYVLFTSSAENLATNINGIPYAPSGAPVLNAFVRDRILGITTLVSVNTNGTGGGNDDSIPVAISTNGQFVLFESAASNLVPMDNNGSNDVFIRDLVNSQTTLVSVATNGSAGNGSSQNAAFTSDGRYVAFSSSASNLVPGDTNGIADVFVRDTQLGITTLLSPGAQSTVPGISRYTIGSDFPQISFDGRYIAFYSSATNLIPGVASAGEIYLRDTQAGTIVRASAAARTIATTGLGTTNIFSHSCILSDDGQSLAFLISPLTTNNRATLARYNVLSGLIDTVNTNVAGFAFSSDSSLPTTSQRFKMTPDGRFLAFAGFTSSSSLVNTYIYVWDGQSNSTTLATRDTNNAIPAKSICDFPVLDSTGRYVAFLGNLTNLTPHPVVSGFHLYVRDFQLNTTTLVDTDTNGNGSGARLFCNPEMSSDGRIVAFESPDSVFVANDNNRAYDVFVHDLATNTVELISTGLANFPSVTQDALSRTVPGSLSTNGRYAAFMSDADNLNPNDTNSFRDVFVRDRILNTNILASVDSNGITSAAGMSFDAVISGDGRYVAFASTASNLVIGVSDANKASDIFVRDLQNGTTVLASVSTVTSKAGNAASFSPIISADGRYVVFHSLATDLITQTPSSVENIYWRDLVTGTTQILSANKISFPTYSVAMSPDGRFVAFGGATTNNRVWDMQSSTIIYSNTNAMYGVAITVNGQRLAFATVSPNQINVVDLVTYSNLLTQTTTLKSGHQNLRFSTDGRYLVYVQTAQSSNQVWCYDFQVGTNILISRAFNSSNGGLGHSDSPEISGDGRFIAYRSAATNIVPGNINGTPNVFLYDQTDGATTLVSVNSSGTAMANNRSLAPIFSPDSQTLVFESAGSDLTGMDFNQSNDLFALSLYTSTTPTDFNIAVTPASSTGNATLGWPITPGRAYQVQFKNDLSDAAWQNLVGNVTFVGAQAVATDLASSATHRFYRVVAF